MPIRVAVAVGFLMAALSLSPPAAVGQRPAEIAFADPQPHFVAAWAPKKPREAERSAVLVRRLSLELVDVTLDSALKELTAQAGLNITYSPAVLPAGKRVTIKATDIAVVTALTEILFRSGLDVMVDRDGALGLVVCRHPAPRAEILDSGTIVGTVTDKATGAPLSGAAIAVEGTAWSATTASDGRYRITGVEVGTYMVRVRYIGYAPISSSVTVTAGAEETVDFGLMRSVQRLDDVVTTGTTLPSQVRDLPTPVTIVTSEEISRQNPRTINQIFRTMVPSAVAWDIGTDPQTTILSTRGASTLEPGVATMKVYLDGIEITDRRVAAVDPASIERVEVVRGPQAATLYGSDAIGGVMQIFTKRGEPGQTKPQVLAEAGIGTVESPYEGSGAVRQEYQGSVRGGSTGATYSFGGSYTRTGAWVPEGATSVPSGFAGIQLLNGPVSVDVSGRFFAQRIGSVLNPALQGTGLAFFAAPLHRSAQFQEQTVGTRVSYNAAAWWQHILTAGVDHVSLDIKQTRPRLTSLADTLLFVYQTNERKVSIGYNSSFVGDLSTTVKAGLTIGFDHYELRSNGYFTSSALNTSGSIVSLTPPAPTRDVTNNTGYFVEARLTFHNAIALTGGARLEENTNFGDAVGTPVSPRVGIAYTRQLGETQLKWRAAYGEAIRPPSPSRRNAVAQPFAIQLANPDLGAERQRGWDVGIDAVFGARGSISATYYRQTALNLVQLVFIDANSVPQTHQFQNVGRVQNQGVEVEGSINTGLVQLRAQYAFNRSRPEDLGPSYGGDLHIGDQVLLVPRHSAGAALTASPLRGTALTLGLAYVGSWRNYDNIARFSCFGGTGPCQASSRDYITEYPALTKLTLSASQDFGSRFSGYVAFEDLTNSEKYEFDNSIPVMGRVSMIGIRARL